MQFNVIPPVRILVADWIARETTLGEVVVLYIAKYMYI